MWYLEVTVALAVALMSHLAASVGKCFGDVEETETEMVQIILIRDRSVHFDANAKSANLVAETSPPLSPDNTGTNFNHGQPR